jgi:HlyD family secretion protein
MKKLFVILGALIALGAGVLLFVQHTSATKEVAEEFTFEVLSRGNIQNLVSSTGTLEAMGTVELGSQIAGTVDRVYVDYNDRVKKGQLLAVIDTTALEISVRDAEASLTRSKVQLRQAQTDFERHKKLFEEGLISEMSFLDKETAVETAAASVESAQAALERNQTNLKYAEIRSPITGTVIERAVEAGQTISSNGNATLFIIAEDLANMQIEALVDESDIGQIKEDMAARFTVQAFPDDEFNGIVRQIRLNPTVQQDVVNYTVIVDAENTSGALLPGMTATVDFVVEECFNVLLVPNTALYFHPSQVTMADLRSQFQEQTPTSPVNAAAPEMIAGGTQRQPPLDVQGNQPAAGMPQASQNAQVSQISGNGDGSDIKARLRQRLAASQHQIGISGQAPNSGQFPTGMPSQANQGQMAMAAAGNSGLNSAVKTSRVFYLDESGQLAMARFTAGATDGANTEVLQSTQLVEGMRIVTGVEKTSTSSGKSGLLSSLRIPGLSGGGPAGNGGQGGGMGGPPPGTPF